MKLRLENISKHFGATKVLDSVSLDIDDGEFVSLVGTSGCGKTTLLRIVAGLEPASQGRVALAERVITQPDPAIAVGFQSDRLLPWRSIRKNVTLGLEFRRQPAASYQHRVDKLLELVGLQDFQHYYPYQLSGGMKQRVNLARALAVDPEVLLLDEPFAALDAQTREVMQSELLRIWQEAQKTVMFVTHQIDEAVYLSDRVIVLRRRPGSVREVVDIDLGRPRELSLKRTPKFNSYVEQIWSMLDGDLRSELMETTASLETPTGRVG